MSQTQPFRHIVVLGGSIAGLCAAAGLARACQRLTIIERDREPAPGALRKSTPQAGHIHALLRRGQASLDELLPGLFEEVSRRGGQTLDMAGDFRWFIRGRWRPRFDARMPIRAQSRTLLEQLMRERIAAMPGVELRFGAAVDEPVHDDRRRTVRGVRLRDGTLILADLVVDATGRGSRSPVYLRRWGYEAPAEEAVEIGLAYVTAELRFDPACAPPRESMLIYPRAPQLPRGGTLVPLEDDRWLATFFGYHGDHPPMQVDALRSWAETLARPELAEIMRRAEVVGPLRRYKLPRQLRRRYDKLRRRPEGFVVVGDAACGFDPVFGQGMTVAAMQAVALRDCVARGSHTAGALQRAVARVSDAPWRMATMESQRWPQARGYRPRGADALLRVLDRYYEVAASDPQMHRAFLEVMHLEKPLGSLLRPKIVYKLLRGERPADAGPVTGVPVSQ